MGSRLQCGHSRKGTTVFMRLRSAYRRLTAFLLQCDCGILVHHSVANASRSLD
ncbi:hypothetical protein M405DRAFT_811149, partial [Rhizopogon salebrosus TDB-379]